MRRYKGGTKASSIERDFPHHVEFMVPEGGFGKRLHEMHKWHHARSIAARHGRTRRDDSGWYVTFCFADAKAAQAFSARFAGKYLSPP
jgi:hypothetical protein